MSKNTDLVAKVAKMLQEGKDIEEIEVTSWWMFWRKLRIKKSPGILVAETSVQASETPPEITVIKATLVGRFRHNDKPLTTDDQVQPGTITGFIEALGLETEIESEVTGKIIAVEIENGQVVEYGQVLFRVELA